jgi:hypothetical protein
MTEPTIAQLDRALDDIARLVADLQVKVAGVEGTIESQRDVLRSVDGLKETVDALIARFNAIFPPGDPGARFYAPVPTPRFWLLEGPERERAIARLREWVAETYPVLGVFHRRLPKCWEEHDFCLTVLDVLSELHSCLYLQPARNQGLLSGQAELLTRLLPALADLMVTEVKGCEHQAVEMYGQKFGVAS